MAEQWRVEGFDEVRELGAGAFGRVALARRAGSEHLVAIKYLHRPGGVDGLRAEAALLGKVSSPYVVRLYRFVTSDDGQAAIVMEAVEGVSLKRVLEEHGKLSPEAALVVLKGSLLGLHAAHERGVVHRDYKPANVLVRPDGLSKLADFGIAAHAGQAGSAGTPLYMAPEQWEKQPASAVTDVYAATCVFYQCLTGRPPFPEKGLAAQMNAHLRSAPDLAEIPSALHPLVGSGMAKNPWDRPDSARDLAERLEQTARQGYGPDWEQRGVRALAAGAAAVGVVVLGAVGLSGGAGAGAVGTGGGALAAVGGAKVAAAVAVGVAVVGGAGYAVSQTGEPRPSPRPTVTLGDTTPVSVPVSFNVGDGAPIGTRAVTVPGLRDAALREKVNKALRKPLDDMMTEERSFYLKAKEDRRDFLRSTRATARGTVTSRVGIAGPRYVSVAYSQSGIIWYGSQQNWLRTATVDLTTGRTLTTQDLYPAALLTTAGIKDLNRRIPTPSQFVRPGEDCGSIRSFSAAPYRPVGVLAERTLLTRTGAEFAFGIDATGACAGFHWSPLAWDRLNGVLKPEVVAAARASR